ncbi:MAG: Z1 domain-containing protein [Turicibacter sp.]|nr:Z1 domain-containing protein [Turicibacter sp.]
MNLLGDSFQGKKDEYSEEQKQCIVEAVEALDHLGTKPLMMLGKIQSGKTKTFIGVIALAFDNGYDLSVVLTKNSNALAKQTTSRLQGEFKEFVEDDLIDVYDIMSMPSHLSAYEMDKQMIIVVKKEKNNLKKLMNFIQEYAKAGSRKCLIIDDEADYCSIRFEKNKETKEFDLRKISEQINDLRLALDCKFVQVTATPYALYLQPDDIVLNGELIEPIKPAKTVLVPYGEGYIGGDYYFDEEVNPYCHNLFEIIDPEELAIIKQSDRRRFKIEEVLTSKKITGLRTAILTFLVGGCIRFIQNNAGNRPRGKENKFSFIVHTEIAKASHGNQYDIVNALIEELQKKVAEDEAEILKLIVPVYSNLKESITDHGFTVPALNDVMLYFKHAVKWVNPIVVNSEKDMDTLLDESGQLKVRTPLTIFLGGQILDRGITISNLIGFYYGRRPQKMQQDTVLQHARMFGYRNEKDLAVTKLYTTLDLYERMKKINEMDAQLRDDFENGKLDRGVIFIGRDPKGKIIPCSPNKVMMSDTKLIKSHKRIVPYGFNTKSKTAIQAMISKIDTLVKLYNRNELNGQFMVPKEVATQIIDYFYETIECDDLISVDKKSFLGMLEYLSTKEVHILSKINREMPRLRGNGEYITSPEGAGLIPQAKALAISEPTLILLRQNGRKEQGWKDAEFWWPILIAPEKTETAMFTAEVEL